MMISEQKALPSIFHFGQDQQKHIGMVRTNNV